MSKPRINFIHDVEFATPLQGEQAMHCGKCLKEKPEGVSPKEWARQQLWITKEGYLQLWCNRHECNITLMRAEVKEETNGG